MKCRTEKLKNELRELENSYNEIKAPIASEELLKSIKEKKFTQNKD